MLDAGFAPLTFLKSRLLPGAAAGKLDWDEQLRAIGRAMKVRISRHCSREFDRKEDAQDVFDGRAREFVLRRYPVEEITQLQLRDTTGSLTALDVDYALDGDAGLIEFAFAPTRSRGVKLVATYKGGYWLDPLDGSMAPEGAVPLPDDVLEAWVLQCQAAAESRGIFRAVGLRQSKNDRDEQATSALRMLPEVIEALRPYRRFGGG